MSNAATKTNLIAHTKALEAAGTAIRLVMRVPAPLKSIADQVIRSNHWRIAYASAKEVDSHLKLLAHAGAINRNESNEVMKAFDQVRAMTWRLLNPKHRMELVTPADLDAVAEDCRRHLFADAVRCSPSLSLIAAPGRFLDKSDSGYSICRGVGHSAKPDPPKQIGPEAWGLSLVRGF